MVNEMGRFNEDAQSKSKEIIEYDDMSEIQQKIVDAAEAPSVRILPSGLSREELIKWMKKNWFGIE